MDLLSPIIVVCWEQVRQWKPRDSVLSASPVDGCVLLNSAFSLAQWPAPRVIGSAANMPTQLEMAMDTMIRIFHRYSCKEGDRFKLNKGELKMLLQRELTEFLTCQKDPQLVDKIMQDLDANKDNEVDFNEFVVMVAALTVACNDYFVEQLKKKGK